MSNAWIFLAEGFEEVEAVTAIDFLRRAGVVVTIAAVGGFDGKRNVAGSHGITLEADVTIKGLAGRALPDALLLPGGLPGAENLAASPELDFILKKAAAGGKCICAICAAPAYVLGPKGLLDGKRFTCYPGAEARVASLHRNVAPRHEAAPVVADGGLITSRAPGTAAAWTLAIVERLVNKETADKLAADSLLR
jgi:4-methyl-5(b-hydroxyethyl)-thiazole monophosphate biosynthesis